MMRKISENYEKYTSSTQNSIMALRMTMKRRHGKTGKHQLRSFHHRLRPNKMHRVANTHVDSIYRRRTGPSEWAKKNH